MPVTRDVSLLIQVLREFLLKQKNVNPLRFANEISPRTQPPPNLPPGPYAKISCNYYYTRDARRLVKPDEILVEGGTTLQLPGVEQSTTALKRIPGPVQNWDS